MALQSVLFLVFTFTPYTGIPCDSENEHSVVTAVVATVHISVTAVTTDSAVTALSVATTLTVMCTSLSQRCQCHRCHTSVHSNVTSRHCHRCCTVISLHH